MKWEAVKVKYEYLHLAVFFVVLFLFGLGAFFFSQHGAEPFENTPQATQTTQVSEIFLTEDPAGNTASS